MIHVSRTIKRIITLLGICGVCMLLTACGGQKERAKEIPTEAEALASAEAEWGIRDAEVLDVRDVRNEGGEYYGIDAIYTMKSDRLDEFTVLRSWSYDSLFWGGYYYNWLTDYSDLVMADYIQTHPLPEGISYSECSYAQSDYGARSYFGEKGQQIWFEFTSDDEFEGYLDAITPWMDEWLSYERQYLTAGKAPVIEVIAYRPQDDTMNYSIVLYRTFGYEKDSFHTIGEDGQTYRWTSFKKAMEAGYKAKKRLVMK